MRTQLAELQRHIDADELMISMMMHDPAVRLRSYELVADVAPFRSAATG